MCIASSLCRSACFTAGLHEADSGQDSLPWHSQPNVSISNACKISLLAAVALADIAKGDVVTRAARALTHHWPSCHSTAFPGSAHQLDSLHRLQSVTKPFEHWGSCPDSCPSHSNTHGGRGGSCPWCAKDEQPATDLAKPSDQSHAATSCSCVAHSNCLSQPTGGYVTCCSSASRAVATLATRISDTTKAMQAAAMRAKA
mmetsp:Transcript_50554/g.93472  ORF Transcript_50554/g.93472 Transcript_50554/m.93472 type:complete len:200 (-) Transcript_50554:42-641(-)